MDIQDRAKFVQAVIRELDRFDSIEEARLRLREEYQVLWQADANADRDDDQGFELFADPESDRPEGRDYGC